MNFIIIPIYIFLIAILVFSFINIDLSISLYVSYLILVPYLQISLGGLSLSYNLVNIIILVGFIYNIAKEGKIKFDYKIINPFLFLFGLLLLLSLFEQDFPWSTQLNNLRFSFMSTCILPFIIWNLHLKGHKILTYLKWGLIGSFIISCLYGIYLMKLHGDNPYTSFLATYFGAKVDIASTFASKDPRLSISTAGKIQSTMIHPMRWGIYLCFMVVIITAYLYKEKKTLYLLFLPLLVFNVFISGVRTAIAALIIGFFYFVIGIRKFKILLVAAIVVISFYFVVNSSKGLQNIFSSFTSSESNVGGSSIDMRLSQLNGAIDEIKGRALVGKGYGWTGWYQETFGPHPVMLDFESLIIVILCEGGIIGMCIWTLFFIFLFRLNRKLLVSREDISFADTLIIVYLAYAIGTGDYGYIEIFSFFYALLICYLKAKTIYRIRLNPRL
jgi:O-Antigen ligase